MAYLSKLSLDISEIWERRDVRRFNRLCSESDGLWQISPEGWWRRAMNYRKSEKWEPIPVTESEIFRRLFGALQNIGATIIMNESTVLIYLKETRRRLNVDTLDFRIAVAEAWLCAHTNLKENW